MKVRELANELNKLCEQEKEIVMLLVELSALKKNVINFSAMTSN